MQHLKRPHYAWLICLGGAPAFCASMGLVQNLFALCLPDIILDLNLTNTQGSWLTTTRSLFTLAAMLVATLISFLGFFLLVGKVMWSGL